MSDSNQPFYYQRGTRACASTIWKGFFGPSASNQSRGLANMWFAPQSGPFYLDVNKSILLAYLPSKPTAASISFGHHTFFPSGPLPAPSGRKPKIVRVLVVMRSHCLTTHPSFQHNSPTRARAPFEPGTQNGTNQK